jgi:hypothetical protein
LLRNFANQERKKVRNALATKKEARCQNLRHPQSEQEMKWMEEEGLQKREATLERDALLESFVDPLKEIPLYRH